jgi:hypothetical protein
VPAVMEPVGVIILLEGIIEVCRHFPAPALVWWMSSGESLGLELDRRNGDVFDIVSCWSILFGDTAQCFLLCHSGVHHFPRLTFKGSMYDIAGDSKTMTFLEPTESCHLLSIFF